MFVKYKRTRIFIAGGYHIGGCLVFLKFLVLFHPHFHLLADGHDLRNNNLPH